MSSDFEIDCDNENNAKYAIDFSKKTGAKIANAIVDQVLSNWRACLLDASYTNTPRLLRLSAMLIDTIKTSLSFAQRK